MLDQTNVIFENEKIWQLIKSMEDDGQNLPKILQDCRTLLIQWMLYLK